MLDHSHWQTEESFWLDGPQFYRRWMLTEAIMVFPHPVGILVGDKILAGLKDVPRWNSVEMLERRETRSGDVTILAYSATARREEAEIYQALCASTYVKVAGLWKLLGHQQSPI